MTEEEKSQEKKENVTREVHPIFAPILEAIKGKPIIHTEKEKKND